MHELDQSTWIAIDTGQRVPQWQDLFGHPAGADYLTENGKAVGVRAARYLETFFGATWLRRAMDTSGPEGVPIPALARFSPVLTPFGQAGAFVELVRWWASLEVVEEVPGFADMQRDSSRNVTQDRLLHTLTQARLAAAGTVIGATAVLEPPTTRGAADVLLGYSDVTVLIEVVTVSPDMLFQQENAASDLCLALLHDLAREYDVHWDGDVPGQLPRHEFDAWKAQVSRLAAEAQRQGQPAEMPAPRGGQLTARPGQATGGTSLAGPLVESDQGHRLLMKLQQKANQTRGAAAWIWVEDHGLFQPFTRFNKIALEQKVSTFTGLVADVMSENPHVAGIVLSNAGRRVQPLPPDRSIIVGDGVGLLRGLPVDRERETILAHQRLLLPDQTRLVVRLASDEPSWLDLALHRLGILGGVRSLLRDAH